MFEDFRKIIIKGGCFDSPSELELFKDKQCLSIVYGHNGSGKSTIAKAVRRLVGKYAPARGDDGDTSCSLSGDAEKIKSKADSVFVFDEDFLRDSVRTKRNGLETIVMLGAQVGLDTQLDGKLNERDAVGRDVSHLVVLKADLENKNSTSSYLYFERRIRSELQSVWAENDRIAKGNQNKTRVDDAQIERFASMPDPVETENELRQRLDADLLLYRQTKEAQEIMWHPAKPILPESLDDVKKLLERVVEKPELSERELRLLAFLQGHSEHYSLVTVRQLVGEKWAFCPLCLREIGERDSNYIGETLVSLLGKEVEDYSNALEQAMGTFANVEMAIPQLPQASANELLALQSATDRLNKFLAYVRSKIGQRRGDIYTAVTEAFNDEVRCNYAAHVASYKDVVGKVEAYIEVFNRSVKERHGLKEQIIRENDLLARKRLETLLDGYKKAYKSYEVCKDSLLRLGEDKKRLDVEIDALKARMAQTDIALEYINEQLRYVFYNGKRVKLVSGDGCYKLMVNERNVSPADVSVGERNVLGLCYFFASIFSNKRSDCKYSDEMLVLVDAPVSSFDDGNRLGVMSLLRYQFCRIKSGNANSRMLVFTHDLRSAFDLVKVNSSLNGDKGGERKFLELADKRLTERKVSSEYKKLLEYVYDFAKNQSNGEEEYTAVSIGNVMRRLMEAFASFCYNMSFEKMMRHEGVLKAMPEEKRNYYANFMCRLALNGDSHMEERVYELNTITPYFAKQELVQTAKSLLLFLHYVNKEHLSCYFSSNGKGDEDKMSVIESWKTEEAIWMG